MREHLDIRPYQKGDEKQILELFGHAFAPRQLSLPYWSWRFQDNPYGPAVIELAWQNDRLVAHYAVTRLMMRIAGETLCAGLTGTVMTHRDFRGRGLLSALGRKAYQDMADQGIKLVWGFPNSTSHRTFVRDLHWRDIYEVPMFRLPLNALKAPSLQNNPCVREGIDVDERFDRLWRRVCGDYDMVVCRNRAYLAWRLAKPTERYRVVTFSDGDELRGYAVFKRYSDEFQLVDLLSAKNDREAAVGLIGFVIGRGLEEKVQSVSLWLAVAHPVHSVLESLGLRPEGPVTYLAGLALDPDLDQTIYDHRRWSISMIDSDVF